jgi:hypothetical protein
MQNIKNHLVYYHLVLDIKPVHTNNDAFNSASLPIYTLLFSNNSYTFTDLRRSYGKSVSNADDKNCRVGVLPVCNIIQN